VTPDDVYAMVSAGAQSGALGKQEHQLIENVFELDTKTVPSAMTTRDSIIYFDRHDDPERIKEIIAEHPHSKFMVCDGTIDQVLGVVIPRTYCCALFSSAMSPSVVRRCSRRR